MKNTQNSEKNRIFEGKSRGALIRKIFKQNLRKNATYPLFFIDFCEKFKK